MTFYHHKSILQNDERHTFVHTYLYASGMPYIVYTVHVKPLSTDDNYTLDFGHMLLVGAIPFEDRFCASRKGGMRGGGWVHPSR